MDKLAKKDRIRVCLELMIAGRWINGITGAQLAEKWQVREETVSRDAAEASRRIRESIISDTDLKSRLHLMLDGCIADCEQIKRACGIHSRVSVDAIRAKIEAIKMLGGLNGLESKSVNVLLTPIVAGEGWEKRLIELGWTPPEGHVREVIPGLPSPGATSETTDATVIEVEE